MNSPGYERPVCSAVIITNQVKSEDSRGLNLHTAKKFLLNNVDIVHALYNKAAVSEEERVWLTSIHTDKIDKKTDSVPLGLCP